MMNDDVVPPSGLDAPIVNLTFRCLAGSTYTIDELLDLLVYNSERPHEPEANPDPDRL